jgi:dephospho-CoA kinase
MIIAITGQIGAGKTTAAQFLKEAGFKVMDVDDLGHEVLQYPEIKQQIVSQFGHDVLDERSGIDSTRLASLVFIHLDRLKILNNIVHPALRKLLSSRLHAESGDTVIDAALCNELGIPSLADRIILVSSDTEVIFERLKNRYTKEQIQNIMSSQSLVEDPDYRLENNSTKEELRKKVLEICKRLK